MPIQYGNEVIMKIILVYFKNFFLIKLI